MTRAWWFALMNRLGKTKEFPKRPNLLWEKEPDQTVAQMIALAKAWAATPPSQPKTKKKKT